MGATSSRSKRDTGRDPGGFVALPWSVLDSDAYARLSHPARSLLLEFARQFVRDNNGQLLASNAYLAKRGWKSPDVFSRAKRDLLEAGFIFETVKGHRPNKASWYAVTWRSLDKHKGYDPGVERAFERGAYLKATPMKINGLITRDVIGAGHTATPDVIGARRPITSPVTIKAVPSPAPITPDVIHLDMPSAGAFEMARSVEAQ